MCSTSAVFVPSGKLHVAGCQPGFHSLQFFGLKSTGGAFPRKMRRI